MPHRTGFAIPLSLRAGCWLPVLLLSSCQSVPEMQQSAQSTALHERIEALESRQKDLEFQFEYLRKQFDDSTSRPALGRADTKPAAPMPSGPISIAGLAAVGAPTAMLTIIEYSDFQCPYCRRYFLETWPLVEREYVRTGQVRYVFHHLPLDRIHPVAVAAAEGAECAARQGRFWEMHDRLFENPRALQREALTQHAAALQLDVPRFTRCMATEAPSNIRSQISNAARLGVTSTPTFFIGRIESNGQVRVLRRIAGAQPFPVFKDVLEHLTQPSGQPARSSEHRPQ